MMVSLVWTIFAKRHPVRIGHPVEVTEVDELNFDVDNIKNNRGS